MSRKIFKSISTAAILVFFASLILFMGISYRYFSNEQRKQLRAETELAASGVTVAGTDYFEILDAGTYRITWIAADGTVLHDSEVAPAKMGNHLKRAEVQDALKTGFGESSRYSSTLANREFYAAERLPDGSVLRLSIVEPAIWTLLLGYTPALFLVILLALALSFFLASHSAKKITDPINNIDPDNPSQYYDLEGYKEVEPLLHRLDYQQAQIKSDQAEIERSSLIRQEFTANVSHELKTPLHVISGYAELLENGMVKQEDIKPFAGKIRTESGRMSKLVEDIIDLTRLDRDGADMLREDCDLYRIAKNAADSLEPSASSAGVTIVLSGVSSPMHAVPQLLYSIVYNLCSNAVKYTHKGDRVLVSVKPKGENVVLRVKDTGIGIPEDSLERIFERFYRVDKSRSKEVGGTGLGLSIVKHAVMVHHGQIELHSKVGEGTEFIITLPKQEPEKEEEA